jgi:pimeloyl-ACP methyl ester carboxylesterase
VKRLLLVLLVLVVLAAAVLWVAPGLLLRANVAWERGRAGVAEKSVTVDTDTVVYTEGGSGEPAVMVHGFAADKDSWTRFARFVTPKMRVVAPDLPGFGLSTRDQAKRYDIESQVKRLHRFVEVLGLGKVHLVGNSMGGQIAAVYAATYPDEVLSLALFAPGGITSPHPSEISESLAKGNNPLLVHSTEDFDRMLHLLFVEVPSIPGPLKRYFAEQAVEHRDFNAKVWADLTQTPAPLEPRLGQIHAKTLVLWGDTDRVLDPSGAEVLKAGLQPPPEVVLMKSCGHVPMIERPEEAAEHYLRFLGK